MSGRPIVIKYGGSLLEEPGHRQRFLRQVADLSKTQKVILVHGGGKEITRQMEAAGIQAKFVNGRRFTDEPTMRVVEKALSGVNREIVTSLKSLGVAAEGFSGREQHMLEAEAVADLGRVGIPKKVDPAVLESIMNRVALPVFYSVADDADERPLNVNADDFAQAIAIACKAQQLVFLTDTGGILGKDGKLIRTITPLDVDQLISYKVITGGMIIKAQASIQAVRQGVGRVDIVKGIDYLVRPNTEPEGTFFSLT